MTGERGTTVVRLVWVGLAYLTMLGFLGRAACAEEGGVPVIERLWPEYYREEGNGLSYGMDVGVCQTEREADQKVGFRSRKEELVRAFVAASRGNADGCEMLLLADGRFGFETRERRVALSACADEDVDALFQAAESAQSLLRAEGREFLLYPVLLDFTFFDDRCPRAEGYNAEELVGEHKDWIVNEQHRAELIRALSDLVVRCQREYGGVIGWWEVCNLPWSGVGCTEKIDDFSALMEFLSALTTEILGRTSSDSPATVCVGGVSVLEAGQWQAWYRGVEERYREKWGRDDFADRVVFRCYWSGVEGWAGDRWVLGGSGAETGVGLGIPGKRICLDVPTEDFVSSGKGGRILDGIEPIAVFVRGRSGLGQGIWGKDSDRGDLLTEGGQRKSKIADVPRAVKLSSSSREYWVPTDECREGLDFRGKMVAFDLSVLDEPGPELAAGWSIGLRLRDRAGKTWSGPREPIPYEAFTGPTSIGLSLRVPSEPCRPKEVYPEDIDVDLKRIVDVGFSVFPIQPVPCGPESNDPSMTVAVNPYTVTSLLEGSDSKRVEPDHGLSVFRSLNVSIRPSAPLERVHLEAERVAEQFGGSQGIQSVSVDSGELTAKVDLSHCSQRNKGGAVKFVLASLNVPGRDKAGEIQGSGVPLDLSNCLIRCELGFRNLKKRDGVLYVKMALVDSRFRSFEMPGEVKFAFKKPPQNASEEDGGRDAQDWPRGWVQFWVPPSTGREDGGAIKNADLLALRFGCEDKTHVKGTLVVEDLSIIPLQEEAPFIGDLLKREYCMVNSEATPGDQGGTILSVAQEGIRVGVDVNPNRSKVNSARIVYDVRQNSSLDKIDLKGKRIAINCDWEQDPEADENEYRLQVRLEGPYNKCRRVAPSLNMRPKGVRGTQGEDVRLDSVKSSRDIVYEVSGSGGDGFDPSSVCKICIKIYPQKGLVTGTRGQLVIHSLRIEEGENR